MLLVRVFLYFSGGHNGVEDIKGNGGPRWRSDEISDGEDEQSPERTLGVTHRTTRMRDVRRSRFAKR